MLTTGEQQELHQIEEDLRDTDRGFAWRLTVLQGLLRWAAQGRQAYLLVLAAMAAGRLLMACAEGAILMDPMAAMALGATAWPGWEPRRAPGQSASPAPDRPQPDGTDLR